MFGAADRRGARRDTGVGATDGPFHIGWTGSTRRTSCLAGRRTMVAVHEGDQVSSLLGLLGGMIRVICAAPTVDELFAIRERVMETIEYEVEPGA